MNTVWFETCKPEDVCIGRFSTWKIPVTLSLSHPETRITRLIIWKTVMNKNLQTNLKLWVFKSFQEKILCGSQNWLNQNLMFGCFSVELSYSVEVNMWSFYLFIIMGLRVKWRMARIRSSRKGSRNESKSSTFYLFSLLHCTHRLIRLPKNTIGLIFRSVQYIFLASLSGWYSVWQHAREQNWLCVQGTMKYCMFCITLSKTFDFLYQRLRTHKKSFIKELEVGDMSQNVWREKRKLTWKTFFLRVLYTFLNETYTAQKFPVKYLHMMLEEWQKCIFATSFAF